MPWHRGPPVEGEGGQGGEAGDAAAAAAAAADGIPGIQALVHTLQVGGRIRCGWVPFLAASFSLPSFV